jgi:hypothetical protein
MKTTFTKFTTALAVISALALGTASIALTGAAQAQSCGQQHYDGSGAPVGPYC